MNNKDLIKQAISEIEMSQSRIKDEIHPYANKAIQTLQDFLRSNAKVTKSKVKLYNYVANDILRPAMTGIFHENGFQYATDGHVMMIIQEECPNDFEGKLIDKKGAIIDAKPLNYRSAIPQDLNDFVSFDVKYFEAINSAYKREKATLTKYEKLFIEIEINERIVKFSAKPFEAMITFCLNFKEAKIYLNESRANIAKSGENICLVMPIKEIDPEHRVLRFRLPELKNTEDFHYLCTAI